MKIHLLDRDERQFTDKENYEYNHGPFSTISIQLNKELKKLGLYSEPDDADFVGISDGLNIGFKYKDKKSFVISVWEYSNTLPYYVLHLAKENKPIIFGLSEQISSIWRKYGFDVNTIYPGVDFDFWQKTCEKDKVFTFFHINSSNVRSSLDLTIPAFTLAFANNKNVKLIIKDTNDSNLFKEKINHFIDLGANIEYISERMSDFKIRDLYSKSHVCINVQRAASFGLATLESMACECYNIVGDIPPSNEIIKEEFGCLLPYNMEISIYDKISEIELNEWGLLNCYPNLPCPEIPKFYDYSIYQYSEKLKDIYENWDKYNKIDIRKAIINWNWNNSVNKLVEYLSN